MGPPRFHLIFFKSACTCVHVCMCALRAQVALMVRKEGEEMGSSFSVLALMWPSFESERSREGEMCFASKKQHLALKCSFSRELVAFREVRSASQKRMRAAYLAGTHTHTEQVDSADSREALLPSLSLSLCSCSAEASEWPCCVP